MCFETQNNHDEITTTDIAKFGSRELTEVSILIKKMNTEGLPEDFEHSEVRPMLNLHSGCVFLTNSEYQVAMLDSDDNLRSFYSCPECGFEGFDDELSQEGEECCKAYIEEIKEAYSLTP